MFKNFVVAAVISPLRIVLYFFILVRFLVPPDPNPIASPLGASDNSSTKNELLMPECVKCKAYTKYNGGLCSKCYREQIDENEDVDIGLTDKEYNYRYGVIKGRIAETLIQELFLSLNYNVFRYGMENTIPGVMELLRGVRSDVSQHIRRMPDFVIQNRDSKDVYFVEVKFRANGEFRLKDLPKDYPYTNAYIIVVTKKHIKCLTVKELQEGKERYFALSRSRLHN